MFPEISIVNSNMTDLEEIFRMYRSATELMKTKFSVSWPEFSRPMVIDEIQENRQWKMIIDNKIACIWATTFSDPLIWEERDEDPSVYIHRIATKTEFRGRNLVQQIVDWAIPYATGNGKRFIRMDTVGDNKKLIEHYTGCGFDHLGFSRIKNGGQLPAHYHNATVCLFQLEICPEG